jgi:hypothetical protein
MEILRTMLERTRVGEGRTFGGLTVFPVWLDPAPAQDGDAGEGEAARGDGEGSGDGASRGGPDRTAPPAGPVERTPRGYRTLDEALEAGTVRITEIGEQGTVPELHLENLGEQPVLLLDGEELVGAKQNRVLNLTVLAPAGRSIVIPVSCVEAGRWRSTSRHFAAERHVMVTKARRSKFRQVSMCLASEGGRRSDQGAVWKELADEARRHDAPSDTGAMREIYRRHRRDLDEYVAAFPPERDQVGAVFAVAGRVRGVEAFDHPETFAALLPKVLRSWALEAIDAPERAHRLPTPDDARAFLVRVAGTPMRQHVSVGLGRDVRIDGDDVTGGALVVDDAVLHVCAFLGEDDSTLYGRDDRDEARRAHGGEEGRYRTGGRLRRR